MVPEHVRVLEEIERNPTSFTPEQIKGLMKEMEPHCKDIDTMVRCCNQIVMWETPNFTKVYELVIEKNPNTPDIIVSAAINLLGNYLVEDTSLNHDQLSKLRAEGLAFNPSLISYEGARVLLDQAIERGKNVTIEQVINLHKQFSPSLSVPAGKTLTVNPNVFSDYVLRFGDEPNRCRGNIQISNAHNLLRTVESRDVVSMIETEHFAYSIERIGFLTPVALTPCGVASRENFNYCTDVTETFEGYRFTNRGPAPMSLFFKRRSEPSGIGLSIVLENS